VSRLFNVLTGFSEFPQWRKLSVAPLGMRDRILELIDRETKHALAGRKSEILAQMNSLAEPDVIRALYRASQAGVKISLIVRGICCLRAGVPGVSDNIRVISIVGRFLEHCRIAYFRNGGDEEVYLASSDWMNRNLFRRVETMFPVDDPNLRRRLIDDVLMVRLKDNVKARVLQPDGSYARVKRRRGEHAINSQQVFLERALEEHSIQEERAFSLDLLLHEAAHDRNGGRPVALTELHPMRSTPPELPAEEPHAPDPRPPDDEIMGVYGSIIADIEASDASGL
jgi:polyphosphate kinase